MVRGIRRDAGAEALGFRSAPGGVHLSKTMMLAELATILDRLPASEAAEVERAIVVDNLLGKPTGSARRLALARLNTLYGILTPRPVQLAALRLWPRNVAGRPVLALLCALAREPLLRQSARPVLDAHPGTSVRWPELASAILAEYPDRYSPKMLKSLAQNCISSWTQSGHLQGRVNKRRRLADPFTGSCRLRGSPGVSGRLRRAGSSPIALDAPIGSNGSRSSIASPPRRIGRTGQGQGGRRGGADRRPAAYAPDVGGA